MRTSMAKIIRHISRHIPVKYILTTFSCIYALHRVNVLSAAWTWIMSVINYPALIFSERNVSLKR